MEHLLRGSPLSVSKLMHTHSDSYMHLESVNWNSVSGHTIDPRAQRRAEGRQCCVSLEEETFVGARWAAGGMVNEPFLMTDPLG